MTTNAKLETLSTELSAYQIASAMARCAPSGVTFKTECRAMNRLEDAAVACGMDRSHGDLESWAAGCVAAWLVKA
jgi:hypothetical protein